MRLFIRLFIAAVLLGGVFGGLWWFNNFRDEMIRRAFAPKDPPPATVSTARALNETWQREVEAVGTLQAIQSVDVAPQVSGIVNEIAFEPGQKVDVRGVTKGRGFSGVIRRHHFAGQDRTHGNSLSHRSPGSIGQRQTPGRVFPGKKMSGHMGAVNQSTQNLEVIKVDADRGLIAVRGAVPGAPGGDVIVRPGTKG